MSMSGWSIAGPVEGVDRLEPFRVVNAPRPGAS